MKIKRGGEKKWEKRVLRAKDFVKYIRERVGLDLSFKSLMASIDKSKNHVVEVRNLKSYDTLKRFIW